MKVSVIYKGSIDLGIKNVSDHETAEEAVLDEISSWPEALFIERIIKCLEIEDIQFS